MGKFDGQGATVRQRSSDVGTKVPTSNTLDTGPLQGHTAPGSSTVYRIPKIRQLLSQQPHGGDKSSSTPHLPHWEKSFVGKGFEKEAAKGSQGSHS